MSVVLVTGAAGFIGSHVAEGLLRRGAAVVGVDNINDYYPTVLKDRNLASLLSYERFQFERGDICDKKFVEGIFKRYNPSEVAHLAARAGVRPSLQAPNLYAEANFIGTLNLLESAAKGGKVQNFVLTSSSSVYGNAKTAPFREDDSATDKPISQYAATKKGCEVLGYTYHHLYGLHVNVVRPFTVYGPRGRPDMSPWRFMEAILKDEAITLYGDGSFRRDFTFIEDFVSGFLAAVERPLGYEIFNLGNSQVISIKEAISIISQICGREARVNQQPVQAGDVELTSADISKAQKLLGYKPKTSFREGMERFHEWFIEQGLAER